MAAVGIDRENFGTFADQQNLLVTDMADQLSIPEIARIDALRQVWSNRLSLLLGHRLTLHGSRRRMRETQSRSPAARFHTGGSPEVHLF